jgi:hypothetical protein
MTDLRDPDRYRFDRSPYERPTLKYRCARGGAWGKPCGRGPNSDGTCGGTAECVPVQNDRGRYECRRPAIAGGACSNGPLPDGSCSQSLPPCSPRRTLRGIRGRLAVLAFGIAVALIGGFTGLETGTLARFNSFMPGPLSAGHAGFIASENCIACHAAHNGNAVAWAIAVFRPADVTASCTNCHAFGGPARKAHNTTFSDRPRLGETTCLMCHTEHRGADANIVTVDDAQCGACHEKQFVGFSKDHPPFSESFPAFRRTSIAFDHASHLGKHFVDARFADRAPATCVSCHTAAEGDRSLSLTPFETACASCHGDQMARRELVVLRLPELPENTLDPDSVLEACGPTLEAFETLVERVEALAAGDEPEELEEEEYEAVSVDELSLFDAYLLDVAADDPDEYTVPVYELMLAMAEGGAEPLADRLNERADRPVAARLLAGLNPEVVKRVACAWAANGEYESPAEPDMGGWFGDSVEIRYRPKGHADPVAASWIEFGIAAARDAGDDESGERAVALRDSLIAGKEGVGACIKCHAVSLASAESAENDLSVEWRARGRSSRPYHVFSHDIHIKLLNAGSAKLAEPEKGCRRCHQLNAKADFASGFTDFDPSSFASNFGPITKETCTECHSAKQVRENCQLCHEYHREPSFKMRISQNDG